MNECIHTNTIQASKTLFIKHDLRCCDFQDEEQIQNEKKIIGVSNSLSLS